MFSAFIWGIVSTCRSNIARDMIIKEKNWFFKKFEILQFFTFSHFFLTNFFMLVTLYLAISYLQECTVPQIKAKNLSMAKIKAKQRRPTPRENINIPVERCCFSKAFRRHLLWWAGVQIVHVCWHVPGQRPNSSWGNASPFELAQTWPLHFAARIDIQDQLHMWSVEIPMHLE